MCIFTGEEWWCLKVHVVHLESFYTRLKRILRICTIVLLYYYDQNPFRIFLSCIFLTLVIPARSKVLICTRKRNPEDSGRSSRMVSSCQWPFSSFLLASALLKSSFYFNHFGTLQSSAVVSYDIINIDKKMNLFALGHFRESYQLTLSVTLTTRVSQLRTGFQK